MTDPPVACRFAGHILDYGADILVGLIVQHGVDANERAVGRNIDPFVPTTVYIGEEIVARLYARVCVARVDAPSSKNRLCGALSITRRGT